MRKGSGLHRGKTGVSPAGRGGGGNLDGEGISGSGFSASKDAEMGMTEWVCSVEEDHQ